MSAARAHQHEGTIPPPERTGAGNAVFAALGDIKLAHSIFALPFAVFAAFLVAPRDDAGAIAWGTFGGQLALVVVCMVFARTWAMVVNRVADHRFDGANPRTARRAIPSGRVTVRQGWMVALGSAALFCAGASLFWVFYENPWPVILALPVLAWIALYSFTKRFTMLCHVFLGAALGASPIAAAIAVGGMEVFFGTSAATPGDGRPVVMIVTPDTGVIVVLVGAFVVLWVAGFDIAYALADIEVDRKLGLRSIPARLGVRGALWVSRVLHVAALAMLIAVSVYSGLRPMFPGAVALVGALLVFEHLVLAKRGVAGLPVAFFTVNGVISVTLATAGITDVLMR